ncbi:MAG: hypothetical protein AVDCRST_MAG93-1896, partial [uncultured Chloroflexia bacterium]
VGPVSRVRPVAGDIRRGGSSAALLDQGQPASERLDVDLSGRVDRAVEGRAL